MRIYITFFISLFIVLSCDTRTYKEILLDSISNHEEGTITDIVLWKGLNLELTLKGDNGKTIFVGNEYDVLMQIKIDDYFIKKENSIKSLVIRKDSIFLIDDILINRLKYEVGDSLAQTIEKWDRKIVNKWYAVNDTMNVKTLLE